MASIHLALLHSGKENAGNKPLKLEKANPSTKMTSRQGNIGSFFSQCISSKYRRQYSDPLLFINCSNRHAYEILLPMGPPRREHIYGINPAFEVIRAGRRQIYAAFINQNSKNHPRIRKLQAVLETRKIPIEWVERGRILDLSSSKENQGVVLKTSPYPYASFEQLITGTRLVLLDNVEDPHNVGAILRCAEVFGFHQVLMARKGTPEIYPSVVKVSAGATEFLQITKDHSATHYAQAALKEGFTLVALDAKGTSSLETLPTKDISRLLLVIGGEDKSVGQYILNHAHFITSISQYGRINSLNASVAAGIAMHALNPLELQ